MKKHSKSGGLARATCTDDFGDAVESLEREGSTTVLYTVRLSFGENPWFDVQG